MPGRLRMNYGRQEIHLGRLFDIPCLSSPHGIYDTLHDFRSGEEFSDALKQRCRRYFGTAGPGFVKRLLEHRDKDQANLKKVLSKYRKRLRISLMVSNDFTRW